MPTDDEAEKNKREISTKYSLLSDVFAVANGIKSYLEKAVDLLIPNVL